ncbi:hypothetical protein NW762_001381 [Fusarium torreyae]|uniref:DUF7730 domain-containing protein n=1 Tax=Fusarium torreyae TaxID=1237075 RepID=A0A9W8SDR7_9HYPO|nr:hypothetical protein NW762_001381 [Fusarium torreyae]
MSFDASIIRRRPGSLLPPAERFRRSTKLTSPNDHQRQSSLFNTLPAEIRRMIYIELFGSQLVHVYFRQHGEDYKREDAPSDAKTPGWVRCICRRGREAVPHYHEEKNHKWCYLSASILRTCQLAPSLVQFVDLYLSNYDDEERPWAERDAYDFSLLAAGLFRSFNNARFYFEDGVLAPDLYVSILSRRHTHRGSPPRHFFLSGAMTKAGSEEMQRDLAEQLGEGTIQVTPNAEGLLANCHGEASDAEDEDHLLSSSGTDDSDTEDEESLD